METTNGFADIFTHSLKKSYRRFFAAVYSKKEGEYPHAEPFISSLPIPQNIFQERFSESAKR